MPAWDVTLNGKEIDTVWFDKGLDKDWVYDALVNHDGYDEDIKVKEA